MWTSQGTWQKASLLNEERSEENMNYFNLTRLPRSFQSLAMTMRRSELVRRGRRV